MIIRSAPPASAVFAVMPVPAPQPTIGVPASICARRRRRISLRGMNGMSVLLRTVGCQRPWLSAPGEHLEQGLGDLSGELRIIDVRVHLDEGDPRLEPGADGVEAGAVGLRIPELVALGIQHGDALEG